MTRITLLLAFLLAASPLVAETLTFVVVGVDCAECGPPIEKALRAISGVTKAKLNWKTSTATVEVPSGFDREKVRKAISNAGFAVVFPGEKMREIERLPPEIVKTLDIVTFADGRKVDIAKTVVPGKITIVDFYADWCGPCHLLETRLEHLMQGKKNLALRRLNIGKWDNPAAKQATALGAAALPYIRIYGADGKFVTSVTGGMWDEVLAAIEKAER